MFAFGTLLIIVLLLILYAVHLKIDVKKRIIDQSHTSLEVKDEEFSRTSLPGSWFAALDNSLTVVDKLFESLRRNRNRTCLHECDTLVTKFYKNRYHFFEEEFQINGEPLLIWLQNSSVVSFCDSKLKVFDRKFALMRNVTLHAFRWDVANFPRGGEELAKFKGRYEQSDKKEILKPRSGLFTMPCKHHEYLDELSTEILTLLKYISFTRDKKNDANTRTLNISVKGQPSSKADYVSNFTIAIAREEYANMYHMTLHMFNIFLMLMAFKQQPLQVSVLILDAHPKAEIDDVVQTLFGPLIRIGQLKRPTYFKNLVLSLPENKSPLSKYGFNEVAYLEEFRSFALNRHLIDENSVLNCNEIKITLVWRRDKVYHPRNLHGTVERKIFNEADLFSALYEKYPQYCIRGFLFETIPMTEQLKIIKNTDILIGMHGAGLTHALYLPKTGGLVELFPYRFKKLHGYYRLFESIARWRKIHYMSWENMDEKKEMNNYFTIVDVDEITILVDNMIKLICPLNQQAHGVETASHWRWRNIMTLHRRWGDVV